MFPTALIYSSHNRCAHIHRDWIVERALKSHDNKTILYLPMSMSEYHQQEYTWHTFRWYFEQFRNWGLHAIPFYWSENLKKEDVDLFFDYLQNFEVVILGGGSSTLGLRRYRALGEYFYRDRGLFGRILHDRQNRGKLTVGFSAGADQLCDYLATFADQRHLEDANGFGLGRNIAVTLHHEWGREGAIYEAARTLPHCMIFGLPNDSGIAVDQGYLPSGNIWQVIEFIIDCSWTVPHDSWHIKTLKGMKIDHSYCDGRHWAFNGGDKVVRVMSPDNRYNKAWLIFRGAILDYWTQQESEFESIDDIFKNH